MLERCTLAAARMVGRFGAVLQCTSSCRPSANGCEVGGADPNRYYRNGRDVSHAGVCEFDRQHEVPIRGRGGGTSVE